MLKAPDVTVFHRRRRLAGKEGIGGKLGVPLPAQPKAAKVGIVKGGAIVGRRRAQAQAQRRNMAPLGLMRLDTGKHGQMANPLAGLQMHERPGVNLFRQQTTQRMVSGN